MKKISKIERYNELRDKADEFVVLLSKMNKDFPNMSFGFDTWIEDIHESLYDLEEELDIPHR